MVDFNKHIFNSDKFRQAAIFFKKNGCYTLAPPGTTDYVQYWDQETQRCIYGYVAPDGDEISGYNYFYLNYFPILRLVKTKYKDRHGVERIRQVRTLEFADFYDYDYYYFNCIEEAETKGKHMVVLKARNKGYSFKGASMLVRNYTLIRESQNFALASDKGYLIADGLLSKAWAGMDFIDKNTAWAKQRLKDTTMERKSGFKITDEFGKQTESGYKSAIIGKTLKDDPDKARGIRGKLILWEEAGNFKDILAAWQIARESVEEAGEQVGLMIAYGTGGTVGANFDGLKEMFYHPDGYNVLSIPNIWDESAQDTNCGFFVPSYANLSTIDKVTQKRLYMDDDGNTLTEKSIKFQVDKRNEVKDGASSQVTVDRYVAENPLRPQEAILEIGGNIFPKKLLMQQLAKIRTNKSLQNMKHIVDLTWDGNGTIKAIEKKQGDIVNFPLPKDHKPDGSIVIWEYPIKDPPFGLYIAGCLTPGEKVYTQRGLVKVENVTLNDQLLSKDGEYVEIKNLQRYKKQDEQCYRIKVNGSYRTTNFTGEHPIFTDKGFVKAKDITKNHKLVIPNRYLNTDLNNYKHSREWKLYYWYGLFFGDGFTNINGNSYDVYLSIGSKYKEFSDYYKDLVKFLFDRKTVYPHKTELTQRFTNKELVQFLNKEFGQTAYNKRIPEWIKKAPDDLKWAFVSGYLDTDGSVFMDKCKDRINFTSVNLELLEDLQDILYSLMVECSIVSHGKPIISHIGKTKISPRQCYRLNIYRNSNDLFYHNICIGFKYKKLQNSYNSTVKIREKFKDKYIYLNIDSIEQTLYTGIVYNFECDTHTFMCRNIATHNCDPLTNQRV